MDVTSGIAAATTAGMTGSAAAMTGTIAAGMEILTAAAVTYDQIGGTRTGKKLIDRKSL